MDCIFDEDSDKRRKLSLKRELQTLGQDRDLLFDLIRTIRGSNQKELEYLLQHLRTTVSLDEVRDCVDESINYQLQTPLESADLADISLQRMRMRCSSVGDLELLHEEPLYGVRSIHKWTSIVNDATASHLFSLFFNWEDQILHFIDRWSFLHDLNTGRRRFCSPLLVHVLLFYACVSSSRTKSMITHISLAETFI